MPPRLSGLPALTGGYYYGQQHTDLRALVFGIAYPRQSMTVFMSSQTRQHQLNRAK